MFRVRNVIAILVAFLALLGRGAAFATDVTVVGLFPTKAVVQINGGAPRTISVGQKTQEGVTLVSVERDGASFDIDGKRKTLKMGQQHASSNASSNQSMTLNADARGHFVVDGQVNGGAIRFLLDTGATMISLTGQDAQRLGIDYRKGQVAMMNTANGVAPAYRVKLDTVRLGNITVNSVDAVVMEGQTMPFALLGMSFLNRMEMRREGQTMTLTKRF